MKKLTSDRIFPPYSVQADAITDRQRFELAL
jgi:hypothetical protein